MKKRKRTKAASVRSHWSIPARTFPVLIVFAVLIFYWAPLTSSHASIQWDAADMHYPLQKYFSDHLRSFQLPFWTPYLFSGYPFLANPEVGAWYPPHWPFFLAGITPWSIQCELALNALLACLGTYFLIGKVIPSPGAALLGAFAYGFSGFFAGHSSHAGLFCSAAGFPLLLLAYLNAVNGSALRSTALGAVAGGFMILAGYLQIPLYAFLALALFAAGDAWVNHRRSLRTIAIVSGILAGATAFAAIQILPAMELTRHSIRADSDYSGSTEGVLTVSSLLTLLAPDWLGALSGNYRGPSDITQNYFYGGLLLTPLALIGIAKTRLRGQALAMLIPALWFMMGPAGGFYRLAMLLPGLRFFRAPIQGWFIPALALAMLAAAGGNWVCERWKKPALTMVLAGVVFIDVMYWNSAVNPLSYARGSFEELYGERESLVRRQLALTQAPLTRLDGPRGLASLGPLDHPLDLRMETTYGYFALEPRVYDEYIAAMSRNSRLRSGLNVGRVLIPQANGLSIEENRSILPRAYFPKRLLDVQNEAESKRSLETLDPAEDTIAYTPHPPVQPDVTATAVIVDHGEQYYRIRYQSKSPNLLKLSIPWYPGWRVTSQSRELPVVPIDHALLGVFVPPGEGELLFRFRSNYFWYGLGISILAAVVLAVLALLGDRRKLVVQCPT